MDDDNLVLLNNPKFDQEEKQSKPPIISMLLQYFPNALLNVAHVSEIGAKKHGEGSWKDAEDGVRMYQDALGRHLLFHPLDINVEEGEFVLHGAQVAWNALAALELAIEEIDDGD